MRGAEAYLALEMYQRRLVECDRWGKEEEIKGVPLAVREVDDILLSFAC